MAAPRCGSRRPLCDRQQSPLCTKRCVAPFLSDHPDGTDRATHAVKPSSCGHPCTHEANRTDHQTPTSGLSELTSPWADTQRSVDKVLQHLKLQPACTDLLLGDSVKDKFLQFHRDITEECGTEDKQHSWAVIEKQEEVIMYRPYYPNYNSGEHSEDTVIQQTQEFLECDDVSEDWKVYIFTMNSPCLARNTEPCMLNLLHKVQQWWSMYGVKTHIGYVKCWGFKGTKETLFRDVNYRQVECINQSEDYESYVKAAEDSRVCEAVFSLVKHLLRCKPVNVPFSLQRQDWKSYFKSMHTIYECKPEEEKTLLTQEVKAMVEATEVLLSERGEGFEECLERGRTFALDYSFSSEICDALQDEMRHVFEQCWREMVQEKYAEVIREKLTEDFNQCTVQLFITDILKVTEEFLQIGKLQFLDSKAP